MYGKGAGDKRRSGASAANPSGTALEIISALQSRTTPVANCVADALALAIRVRDDELRKFCERELSGLRESGSGRYQAERENRKRSAALDDWTTQLYAATGA